MQTETQQAKKDYIQPGGQEQQEHHFHILDMAAPRRSGQPEKKIQRFLITHPAAYN